MGWPLLTRVSADRLRSGVEMGRARGLLIRICEESGRFQDASCPPFHHRSGELSRLATAALNAGEALSVRVRPSRPDHRALDTGYDSGKSRHPLSTSVCDWVISKKGTGAGWVVERTNA